MRRPDPRCGSRGILLLAILLPLGAPSASPAAAPPAAPPAEGAPAEANGPRRQASPAPFRRGDLDGRPGLALDDAVALIDVLRGRPHACLDAADVDDDGSLDVADAVTLLGHLFLGGPQPASPFPACGLDPTRDALGCEAHAGCPGFEAPAARAARPAARGAWLDARGAGPAGPRLPPEALNGGEPIEATIEEEAKRARVTVRESTALPRRIAGGSGGGGRVIELGEIVAGEIFSHSQVDTYVFEAIHGQAIAADRMAAANASGLNWRIEDAHGRILAQNRGSLDDLDPVTLLGGSYTLAVLPSGTGTGSYQFRLVDASPVERDIASGEEVAGEIDADHPGRRHTFDFTAAAGESVFLDSLSSGPTNLDWRLEDARGRVLFDRRPFADRGPAALLGGTYRLTLEGRRSGGNLLGGAFLFRVARVPSPAPRPIAAGEVVSDEIGIPGEMDTFTFSAPAGQTLFLDQLSPANARQFDWELIDAFGRAVLPRTGDIFDEGPFSLAGGDYQIRVYGLNGAIGPYSFRLADAARLRTSISLGVEVAGEVPSGQPGRINVYDFTAPANRLVTVEVLQTSNPALLGCIIEDALGRAVLPRTSTFFSTGPVALLGGSYRLMVLGEGAAAGTYRFRLRDDGPASPAAAGAPVAIGDEVAGAIAAAGSDARYTFTASAGQTVLLDLIAGERDLNWTLADSLGTVLATRLAYSPDSSSDLGPFALAAGSYTIVLHATNTSAYSFRIADVTHQTRDVAIGDVIADDFAGEPGAVHRYRFNIAGAAAGKPVYFDKLNVSNRLEWTLLDPADQPVFPLRRADSTDEDAGPFALAAGSYTLVLDPLGGHEPSYQFAIVAAPAQEDTGSLGAMISGSFAGLAGSTRTVLLDMPSDGKLFVDRLTFTQRLNASILDSAGTPVFGPSGLSTGIPVGPFAAGAGTYRLVLDPPTGNVPAYEMRVIAAEDSASQLQFGVPATGTLGAGATASYSFTALEGQRCFFDLTTGAPSLTWSLFDEFGQAVFLDAAAGTAASDQGPLSLAAGAYRLVIDAKAGNTPSYAFTSSTLAVDLSVGELTASPRVVFEGDEERAVEVTWTVHNLGSGPAPTGAWTDRLLVSTDDRIGNADDVLLGEFVRFATLEPRSSYSRRETVRLPQQLGLGQHRIFVSVDAAGVHPEPGAEADNVARVDVAVVKDLGSADARFVSTTTFPFDFTAEGTGKSLDLPLARPVTLDSVRFILAEGVSLQLIPTVGLNAESELTLSLLSGKDEVLEVAKASPSGGGLSTFVVRFSRRLTPQVVALLPIRTVDGVRIRFDQPSTTNARMRSIHPDGRLYLHFAACEFAPCGPHLERRSPGGESATVTGTEISEWRVVTFEEPAPGDGLRFVSGPSFSGGTTGSIFSLAFSSTEAQLILDNGALVTLDDSRAPSTLGSPAVSLSPSHSLLVQAGSLAGRQVLGFQWRVHGASTGGANATYVPLDDQAIRFLYEAESCGGSIDVPPVALEPPDGSVFAPGSTAVISGRALAPQPGRAVSAVLVNGEAADSLDASGRFFKAVRIAEGENLFAIQVVEPGCGEPEALLHLLGRTDRDGGLSGFTDATAFLRVEYSDTTFLRAADSLLVRARARNASSLPVRGPLLMVLTGMLHPSVTLRGATGLTAEGEPFLPLLESGTLAPGEAGPWVDLLFSNPERLPVRYGVRWLAPADRPPRFESAPPAGAVIGREYRYTPAASDPDGDAVVLELERGPAGMALEAGGVLRWTPAAADAGSHDVSLAAVTSLARATQRWTLTASSEAANRPPFFTSAPATQTAVGAAYAYQASALDPDRDPLVFSLLEKPEGMTIGSGNGRIAWPFALPGEHQVTLRADDGRGGEAVQSFLLGAGSLPSNPSAPRITSTPATEARPGILFIYQAVASDPDGDPLQFVLEEGPAGMTLDEARGRISWTPLLEQEGTHAVSFAAGDGRGGETRQRFEIVVRQGDANLPPVIESLPGGFALAGQRYRYAVEAIDPEGQPLHFALAAGPAGMAIDPASGVLEWTPTAGQAGTQVVSVEAVDARGGTGRQAFEVRVRTANAAPRVTSPSPPSRVIAGRVFQHDVESEDADGDLLRYAVASGPTAIEVHPVTGLVTWRTVPGDVGPGDVGSYTVTVRVTDCCGGEADASFAVEVAEDVTPPAVTIGFDRRFDKGPAPVGAIVEARVSASDDAAVSSRTLTVECPPDAPRELALDVFGRAAFASARSGFCTFRATATDPTGNTGEASAVLQVGNPDDPLDPHPPVVLVLTPPPGSVITAPANIAATVSDATEDGRPGSGPLTWKVEIAPAGSSAFTEIGSGGGRGGGGGRTGGGGAEPTNALLAVLDPTLLPNGEYRLRIVAADGVQTGGVEYDVSIAGELKLGNFTMEVVDLAIPLAGLPIAIARRYDSLDTSKGDFGAGWSLALPGGLTDGAVESETGDGLVDLLATESLQPGDRVYVSRPDGRRVGFTFLPKPAGGLSFIHAPHFEPDPGVDDALEVVEPAGNFFVIAGRANLLGVAYNPSLYKLKTRDGLSYTIDEKNGLQRIENAGGLSVEVRPEGLFSSSGAAVVFERDSEGRIRRIVEPDPDPADATPPGHLDYEYDARGNLTAASNQLGARLSYFYDDPRFPHYLTRIEDPLGRAAVRSVYDEAGRLVAACGPDSDPATLAGCTRFDADPYARVTSITDNLGRRTDLFFDERGNLILERSYLDDGSFIDYASEYDAEDNLVRAVDPSGEVWSFGFGPGHLQTSLTDPLGSTRLYTYGECGRLETETGPTGSVIGRAYKESCELAAWTDPLGNEYRFEYDANGFPSALVDPLGNRWTYRYDGSGYPVEVRDAAGRATTFVVDSLGNLLSQTDPAGRTIEYERDAAHRVVREIWNTPTPRVISYEYDAAGRVTRAGDPDSTTVIEYSAIGRVSRVAGTGPSGVARSVAYEHDARGDTTRVADSLGGRTSFFYDELRRLVSIRQDGASVRPKRVDIEYSASSSLAELRRFADLGGAVAVATTRLEYSCETCDHGLVGVRHERGDGSPLHDISIVRDGAGLVLEVADAEGRHVYAHDGAWRLLAVDHPSGSPQPDESYAYDAAGNRAFSHLGGAHVYAYSLGEGGNELRSDDRFDYEIDASGNVARRTESATGRSTEYRYDHRNRLTGTTERNASGGVLSSSTYFYDALDRRIRAVENGAVLDFIYDGSNPILVLDGAGNVVSRRFYGRGSDTIFADEAGGATRWYLTDHLGTVRDLIGDDGSPIAHYVYDSFGNLIGGSTPIAREGLGFIGRELSTATGLYHVRARPYDPRSGRFLQRDPVTPYQFEYADNSPVMLVDADGRKSGVRRVSQIDKFRRKMLAERLKAFELPKPKKVLPDDPLKIRPSNRGRGGNEYAVISSNIALELVRIGALSSVSGSIVAVFAGIPQRIMDALQDAIDDHIDDVVHGR